MINDINSSKTYIMMEFILYYSLLMFMYDVNPFNYHSGTLKYVFWPFFTIIVAPWDEIIIEIIGGGSVV